MVNSKKMSKSTVAIVLLSLLLVLSLILTATGAWFTASADKSTNGTKGEWTIGDFISLTVEGDDKSALKAYTVLEGVETELEADAKLHPGDTIKVEGEGKISISASDDKHNFWYVVSMDGGATWEGSAAKKYTAGDDVKLAEAELKAVISGTGAGDVSRAGDVITVNEKLTTDAAGHVVTITVEGVKLVVRAIQYNNLTAEQAYAKLTGDFANVNA